MRPPVPSPPVPGRAAVLALVVLASGCVPYAVGGTPATVAPRAVEPNATLQIASGRRDLDRDDGPKGAALLVGNAARLGLDERSDVGLALYGLNTLVATYKRKVAGPVLGDRGVAVVAGAGIVGLSHAHLEATVVVSPGPLEAAPEVVPYAAVRLQDLTPFAGGAADSAPALGLVVGGRFGWPDLALSPELGVFYSPSPVAGDDDVIVVPSVTVRGDRLRRALGI